MEIIRCKDCRWWEKDEVQVGIPIIGKCRLKPPTYSYLYGLGKWPTTKEDDWCGEGETRE